MRTCTFAPREASAASAAYLETALSSSTPELSATGKLATLTRTARPAIPEPPKIRPLAFCTLRIDFICALCCLSAFTHYGFILMSQKNPETESVRDQQ